ncbi:MAG: lysophospholipid acyltransferase family protein [Candidatus Stygibacter australis]|nr:lysophospholipid acyltransferase family protein [Candidatus Stygibacter australis]MDP8322073.1 lysophospholipid acyltransferase family protein [Candidatus Stygibacter australis]
MAKRKFSPLLVWLITNLGLGIVKLLSISWRCRRLNSLPTEKAIFAFWHRNILPLMYLHRNKNYVVIISKSQDGDLIADVCEKLGYLTARGSTSRGGSSALRNMIAQSRKYSLAFTPDGPKGPACKIKEGMVYLAKLTGLPIVLISARVGHEIVFNSWDRFRLPLPFSRIEVIYDAPQYIAKDADIDESIVLMEKRMIALEKQLIDH